MLVEIRPILRKDIWHKITDPNKQFSMPKVYEVYYNEKTGRYNNGLTEKERREFEKALGIDLSDTFQPDQAHPFYSTRQGKMILENRTMVLDTSNPLSMNALKVKFMKVCPFIAPSLKAYEEGLYPDATHFIYDETEEIDKKATLIQFKNRCVEVINKLSLDEKANIVRILSDEPVKERSQNFIDVTLDRLVEEQPEKFLKYANMDKKDVYVRATLLEAISRNILTKEGMAIYYLGERIGNDFEDAVAWFNDPQNQQMKIKLLEKLD